MGPGGMGKAQRHGRIEANGIAELLAGIMYGYVRVICFSVSFLGVWDCDAPVGSGSKVTNSRPGLSLGVLAISY